MKNNQYNVPLNSIPLVTLLINWANIKTETFGMGLNEGYTFKRRILYIKNK